MGFTAGNIIAFGFTAAGKKGLPADVVQNLMDEVVALETAFVNGRVRCSAYHNTTQSLTTAVEATLTFNSEDFDVGTMHDNASNNTRVTIPASNTGVYLAIGGTQFAANATGYRQLNLYKNGSTILATTVVAVSSAAQVTVCQVSAVVSLAAADYLELAATQNSGGNLNAGSATRSLASFLQVIRIW
jgi:hypothetical protein